MTLADLSIQVVRHNHDRLAALVRSLAPSELTRQSACAEWSVAQVLSHLGSGADFSLRGLEARRAPGQDANQAIWDRWNALDPQEQAAGFLDHDERLVQAYESLTATERAELRIDMGFLPEPVDVATMLGFRVNETTFHAWDVESSFDPSAVLAADAVPLVLDRVGAMVGWVG